MKKLILKNANLLQTIEVTYDGFNFNQTITQHGAMLVVLSKMDSEIGGAEEAIEAVVEYRNNGFSAKFDGANANTIREIVHAIDEMEENYDE